MSTYIYDIILLLLNDARLNPDLIYWIANVLCVIITILFWFIIIGFPFWFFYKAYRMIFDSFTENKFKRVWKKRLKK